FFVMGADSWTDIKTWRDWENVLLSSDHIVVTRPGYDVSFDHVTDTVRERIVDLRGGKEFATEEADSTRRIYITDAVHFDTSATEIRLDATDGKIDRVGEVPTVAA